MPADVKIIFIHGYTSSSNDDFYPGVSEKLKSLNIDFEIPDLPGGEHPHATIWLNELHKIISKVDKPLVLIGQSLGTRAALLYLEKYKPKIKLVLLIAAFANRLENATKYDGDGYPDFFEHLIDIPKIKTLSDKFIIIHSKDDALEYWQGKEIAEQLGAKLISCKNMSHFSEDPRSPSEIVKILLRELNS